MKQTYYLYLHNLSLFYLKLQLKYLVPESTIQHIVDELQVMHSLGQSRLYAKLTAKLETDIQLPHELAQSVADEVFSSYLFQAYSSGPLKSVYVRKKDL